MYNEKGTIIDRREMLKIKLKSLAEEARIIRQQEKQAGRNESWMQTHGVSDFWSLQGELHHHRIFVVRKAARDTHIAYGLIRGKTLEQMESNAKSQPDWDAIEKMVKKYGPNGMVVLKKAA